MANGSSEVRINECAAFLDQLVRESDDTFFFPDSADERVNEIYKFEYLGELLSLDQSPIFAIGDVVEQFDSFQNSPVRWTVLLMEISRLYDHENERIGKGDEETEDHERTKDRNDQDHEEEYDEDDEDF